MKIMALKIGNLICSLDQFLAILQKLFQLNSIPCNIRHVLTYAIPDKSIFGNSFKIIQNQDKYQLEYIGNLHNSLENIEILKFLYDITEFQENPEQLLLGLGYNKISDYTLLNCYNIITDKIEIFLYDAKVQQQDTVQFVVEIRVKNQEVKELCHLHENILSAISPLNSIFIKGMLNFMTKSKKKFYIKQDIDSDLIIYYIMLKKILKYQTEINYKLALEQFNESEDFIIKMILIRFQFLIQPQDSIKKLKILKDELRKTDKDIYNQLKNHELYNESWAYICFINDLFKFSDTKLKYDFNLDLQKIYFLGDSHIFSVAYRKIWNKLSYPLLCVGIKAWHFQDKFKDSPQILQLKNHLNFLKDQGICQVILSAGEIDCRENEGIILAVQKGYYENIEIAVQNTIQIYIKNLISLQQEYDLKFILLPPMPSSNKKNPNRSKAIYYFNKFLKQQNDIQMLDIFESLVNYQANQKDSFYEYGILKSQFRLDGTHLSPKLIEVLNNYKI